MYLILHCIIMILSFFRILAEPVARATGAALARRQAKEQTAAAMAAVQQLQRRRSRMVAAAAAVAVRLQGVPLIYIKQTR